MNLDSTRSFTLKLVIGFLAIILAACAFMPDTAFAVSGSTGKASAKYPLKGKSVLIVGDSIQDKSCYSTYGAFIQRTCKSLSAKKIVNRAKKGAPIANVDDCYYYSIYAQVMREYELGRLGKYDYYFIAGGTNDYGGGVRGNGRAKLGAIDSENTRTTCGALNAIIKLIKEERMRVKHKDARIIVVTPIGRYNFTEAFDRDCDVTRNWSSKKTLAQYRDRIADVARQYEGVYVVDGLDLASTAQMLNEKNSYEGLHPRVKFAKTVLVKKFKAQLKTGIKVLAAEEAAKGKNSSDMRKYVKFR